MRNVLRSLLVHRAVLVVLLTGTAALAVLAAPSRPFAQGPQEVRRIGVLSPDPADSAFGKYVQPLLTDELRRLGWEVGRNLLIEWRWWDGTHPVAPLAEDLVKLKVELIVARSGMIPVARDATSSIPIVMLNGNFPVEVGHIKSLAQPGGNVTGTAWIAPETIQKNLQMLKEFAPEITRVGIFLTDRAAKHEWGRVLLGSLDRAAVSLGMTVEHFNAGTGTLEEVMAVLEKMAARGIQALFCPLGPTYRNHMGAITAFLRDRKMVSVGDAEGFALAGGLFDYAPDGSVTFARTASYVDRILKGAKPADLPVELPTKFKLTVNLKTAKALGIAVPPSILLRADRVYE